MSPLFGKKKTEERTLAILDVENGSVGGALVELSPVRQPRLFAQTRKHVPLFASPSAVQLLSETEESLSDVALHLGEVASRLRSHEAAHTVGNVEHISVFLHAPWAAVSVEESGRVNTSSQPEILDSLRAIAQRTFPVSVSFHAFGGAVAPLVHSIFPSPEVSLVCSVSGEVTEVFLVRTTGVLGHASIPLGTHSLLRTLKTHSGFSEQEARSALYLDYPHAAEPLAAVAEHFVSDFRDVAHTLLANTTIENALVIAPEPAGEWFARALAHDRLGDLFESGGAVRAVRGRHIAPYLAMHAPKPDLSLMLAALFIDSRFSGI